MKTSHSHHIKSDLLKAFAKHSERPKSKLGRFIADPITTTTYKLALHGVTNVAYARLFWGKHIILPIDDPETKSFFYGQSLPSSEDRLIKYIINRISPDDIFFDIGANYGFYTLLTSQLIDGNNIHSFEPNPSVFAFLTKNCRDGEVHLNNTALSNTTDTQLMTAIKAGSGKFSLNQEIFETEQIKDTFSVKSTTLDTYLNQYNVAPTILKVDVEGHEQQFLQGAAQTLKQTQPEVVMEVWANKKGEKYSMPAVNVLANLGFLPHRITSDGDLIKTTIETSKIKMEHENFVFKKAYS